MVNSKVVNCSKCSRELFYLNNGYKMACKVVCVECANKKPKKKAKKKTVETLTAKYARIKKGPRLDVHPTYSFRSPTEANFARILEYHGIKWKFEERAFTFEDYKTKPYVYIMDFEILSAATKKKTKEFAADLTPGWYEIKGFMDANARKKLRRLKKNYPEDFTKTCVVIYTKYKKKDIEFCNGQGYRILFYDELRKIYEPLIPTWE